MRKRRVEAPIELRENERMRRLSRSVIAAGTLGAIASSGCGSAMQQTAGSASGAPRSESRAAADDEPGEARQRR